MTHERKIRTQWPLDGWEGLKQPQLKLKLLERMANSEAVQKRFWRKVEVTNDPKCCWNWKGGFSAFGYGMLVAVVGNRRINFGAHRVSYFIRHRTIPEGLFVCHRCDNPACVNPEHLFLATNQGNQHDKVNKMRQSFSEKHGRHILTCDQVQQIRVLSFFLKTSAAELAELYGMSHSAITSVLEGSNWKHLPLPPCIK